MTTPPGFAPTVAENTAFSRRTMLRPTMLATRVGGAGAMTPRSPSRATFSILPSQPRIPDPLHPVAQPLAVYGA